MKYLNLLLILGTASFLWLLPMDIAFAQNRDIQWYLLTLNSFFGNTIVQLMFAIAILFFLVNVVRYFILDATDTEARKKARNFALYAITALVFFSAIWGIINYVIDSFGINDQARICPDYNPTCDRQNTGSNSSGGSNRGGGGSGGVMFQTIDSMF